MAEKTKRVSRRLIGRIKRSKTEGGRLFPYLRLHADAEEAEALSRGCAACYARDTCRALCFFAVEHLVPDDIDSAFSRSDGRRISVHYERDRHSVRAVAGARAPQRDEVPFADVDSIGYVTGKTPRAKLTIPGEEARDPRQRSPLYFVTPVFSSQPAADIGRAVDRLFRCRGACFFDREEAGARLVQLEIPGSSPCAIPDLFEIRREAYDVHREDAAFSRRTWYTTRCRGGRTGPPPTPREFWRSAGWIPRPVGTIGPLEGYEWRRSRKRAGRAIEEAFIAGDSILYIADQQDKTRAAVSEALKRFAARNANPPRIVTPGAYIGEEVREVETPLSDYAPRPCAACGNIHLLGLDCPPLHKLKQPDRDFDAPEIAAWFRRPKKTSSLYESPERALKEPEFRAFEERRAYLEAWAYWPPLWEDIDAYRKTTGRPALSEGAKDDAIWCLSIS